MPKVRLIGAEGEQVGIVNTGDAMAQAEEEGLDLIEVSPNADPPVCRLMDYGKYKYQLSKRLHEAKKHQKVVHVKEIKLRPKTEDHDYSFKLKNAHKFLNDGDKVKVTVTFRGREITHRHLGMGLLQRFKNDSAEVSVIEQPPKDEGRSISMILAPPKVNP